MIQAVTACELADIVNRGRLGTQIRLKKISPTRWRGFCPFHHDTSTPNFDVYEARPGAKGRFICHNCEEKGDAIDWLGRVEGKTGKQAGLAKPDPVLVAERKRENERKAKLARIERMFFDIHPDAAPEWRFIIEELR